ncbi:vomeronasal 1 receptor ornAnaV1R3193 [Ornithorhynchus anatinus]|uniref:Vomeronasal type-1 receptor n=1 Tax=Ornithorhynchus anatinus TaxID=9258 RepID=A0A6I8P3H6_ORNAN|nr:vomeronasal 1 receptor ornAnaV1R3193 [Ornithorhynchus anatinus]
MFIEELVVVLVAFTQTGMGLLGNSVLVLGYVRILIFQPQLKKPTDLILTHLTAVNIVTLLTHGATALVFATGIENRLEDFGCHITGYIRRVTRGLSICTTCLLSMFQAVTISPSTSRWARLKPKASGYIIPSLVFFWVLHLSMYMNILTTTVVFQNVTNPVNRLNMKYCSDMFSKKYLTNVAFVGVITFRDGFFVLLMSWASGYMVIVLYRHHKQVQHIHSVSLSTHSSPETRATHTILLLVTCFFSIYCMSCIISLASTQVENKNFRMTDAINLLGACYPALSPWVLIQSDPRVPRPRCVLGKVRSPSPPLDPSGKHQVSSSPYFLPQAPL